MSKSIVHACPINLFDPILLYLLPKLKQCSGQQPPRPVYAKALYLQQQQKKKNKGIVLFGRNCAVAFVVSSAYP